MSDMHVFFLLNNCGKYHLQDSASVPLFEMQDLSFLQSGSEDIHKNICMSNQADIFAQVPL